MTSPLELPDAVAGRAMATDDPERVSAAARADAPAIDHALLLACGLSVGAGLIHVVAAAQHLEEYALYAVFFAALALAQFAWAVGVYRSSHPRLIMIGAAGSVLVVLLWLASRTVGIPIGPSPWRPEPVGAIDTIASSDELVLALLVVLRSGAPRDRRLGIVGGRILGGLGLWLILLSSLVLIGAKHVH
jgi:hypothetical protein